MPSRPRIAYHSQIKILAREKMLPENIVKNIPKSNIARWRKERRGKYQTFNLNRAELNEMQLVDGSLLIKPSSRAREGSAEMRRI